MMDTLADYPCPLNYIFPHNPIKSYDKKEKHKLKHICYWVSFYRWHIHNLLADFVQDRKNEQIKANKIFFSIICNLCNKHSYHNAINYENIMQLSSTLNFNI